MCIYQFGRKPLDGFRLFQTLPVSREITGMLQNWVPNELFEGQILFTRHNNYLFVSHYESGVNFWVAVRVSPRGRFYLDYQVRVPGIYRQKTRGLMGNLDRNSGNNFFKEYTLILIRREVLTI